MERVDQNSESETTPKGKFVLGGAPGPGRPKGIVDKHTALGRKMAMALSSKAWTVVEELLAEENGKFRLEAAKIVLEYAHGKPRQSIDIDVRDEADRIAAEYGVPLADLMAEVSRHSGLN